MTTTLRQRGRRWTARRALMALPQVRLGTQPVPPPGNPPQYPTYLRPIPVNTRDPLGTLRRLINRERPEAVRLLYSSISAQWDAVKYQELSNMLRDLVSSTDTGAADQIRREFVEAQIAGWRQEYSRYVNDVLAPLWKRSAETGAQLVADAVNAQFVGDSIRFAPTGAQVLGWIEAHGAEMVTYLSDQQREALRHVIEYYTIDRPIPAAELARYIRPIVGLTRDEAAAVVKWRETYLREGRRDLEQALGRALTTAEEAELARKVEHKVGNYWGRLERLRATRIAETETAYAFNRGQLASVQQARADGVFGTLPVEKEWVTAEDERVCKTCGGLNGQHVSLDEPFPGGHVAPPAHPLCRCTWVGVILETRQPGGGA